MVSCAYLNKLRSQKKGKKMPCFDKSKKQLLGSDEEKACRAYRVPI